MFGEPCFIYRVGPLVRFVATDETMSEQKPEAPISSTFEGLSSFCQNRLAKVLAGYPNADRKFADSAKTGRPNEADVTVLVSLLNELYNNALEPNLPHDEAGREAVDQACLYKTS